MSILPSLAAVPSPAGKGGISILTETDRAAINTKDNEDMNPENLLFRRKYKEINKGTKI